jgi:hypothetical protein
MEKPAAFFDRGGCSMKKPTIWSELMTQKAAKAVSDADSYFAFVDLEAARYIYSQAEIILSKRTLPRQNIRQCNLKSPKLTI